MYERLGKSTMYKPPSLSDLPFLGNVIEKAVSLQVTIYSSEHHLSDPLLSAYKAGHSCETALLKVTSDIQLHVFHISSIACLMMSRVC